jgi:hypothetical protein
LTEVVDCVLPIAFLLQRYEADMPSTAFTIFFSNQGSQGLLGQASNQQLDEAFGTHKDVDAMIALLQKGSEQSGKGFTTGELNCLPASFYVDTNV